MSEAIVETADRGIFAGRDESLRLLGYVNYADYLQSALWDWIRLALSEEPSAKACWCCKSATGLVWHHREYRIEVLVGNFSNSPPVIVRLCKECHQAIHFEKNEWFDLAIVDVRLDELHTRYQDRYAVTPREKLPKKPHEEFSGYSQDF